MTRLYIFILFCFSSTLIYSQTDGLTAGTYVWPSEDKLKSGAGTPILAGSAFELSTLEVNAFRLMSGKKVTINDDFEHVLLVKSGTLTVSMKDSTWSLVKGSVVLIVPKQKVSLQNKKSEPCTFHDMKYQSKQSVDVARGTSSGGSIVRDWNKLTFKSHDRGGVRAYFNRPTAMTRRFEMHVTTLKEGLNSHDPHTHKAEEIILVLEGNVETLIGEKKYKAEAGDVIFIPTQLPHGLKNDGAGPCSYFAYQWE